MRGAPANTLWMALGLCACALAWGGTLAGQEGDSPRVRDGLVILYDFRPPEKGLLNDRSGTTPPLDLQMADPKHVRQAGGGVEIAGQTSIQTPQPAVRLIEAIKKSGELSIEAWVRPAKVDQTGPARIVTLSRNTGERNLTVGQDGDKFDVRLRTTATGTNGTPSLASPPKTLITDWTHVVYTFDRGGQARLYVGGKLSAEQNIGGSLSNWDDKMQLAIGNELTGDRPWLGGLRLVAIYSRELTASEVEANYRAGSPAAPLSVAEKEARQTAASARLFETAIAPLISNHCLECHDPLTRQGQLDLSRKAAALAGGENGPIFTAGKSAESRLWQRVAADEMPHDRPPLSQEQKDTLKRWIDSGAVWSLDAIDPAVYVHGSGENRVFVPRLTVPEYIETVKSTLGIEVAKEARELLPRDLRADGFANTAYNLNVDLGHVEAYARLAEIIVGRIEVKALIERHTKSRELTDENVSKVIEPVGRRLFRRPLTKEQVTHYCGISTTVAAAGGNIEEATRYILEAMLQSPQFLYRIEEQRGDGAPRSLDPYELASRLSYALWGGPPDDALLAAAEKKTLDRTEVASQARRMLKDPRAVRRSRQFISQWLDLDRLNDLRPSRQKFPQWDARLAADMRRETLAFFEEVAWKQDRPLSDLLNARVTFVTPRLARHYGLPPVESQGDDDLVRVELSEQPRGGLLTHGSVLTVGGDEASMVTRGLFVMHEVLRGVVRDPPPCVDTTPVPSKPGLTQRAVAESRMANKKCSGCHAKFEPLSFALERFDGLGTYREADEHGNKLQGDGSILFPGQAEPVEYKSSAELMNLLARSDRVRETFTWKITQFALGRPLNAADAPLVAEIHRAAQEEGGTYAATMLAIVTSDLVLSTRTERAAGLSGDPQP